ncbi:hypothetical protein Dxin01_00167 [Deinococcus xinjiangensis]|uniref:Peptidase M15C domain-containing protein n=1 Tax=Deinococcus xinjiangensis TaxID=457454 RepID=A0ABP9V5B8_9DEIO
MQFDYASAIAQRPSDAAVPEFYGKFTYKEAYQNGKATGAVIPDPKWAGANLVKVDLTRFKGFPPCGGQPSKTLWMHKFVAPVFEACMEEAAALGLLSELHEYNGCYVPRHMGWSPKRPLSCHSWGIAVDFDASTNPYGVSRFPISPAFVRHMEERGWIWGGRWTGSYADGMHFQFTDPIPGTKVPVWQDAKASVKKPVLPAQNRRLIIDGQVITQGRVVYHGVTIAVLEDGSAYLRPTTGEEQAGRVAQPPAPSGLSARVTLLNQAGVWEPFAGRAVYSGLMLNLDAKTGDLWIRQATPEELSRARA